MNLNDLLNIGSAVFEDGIILFTIRAIVYWAIAKFLIRAVNKAINETIKLKKGQETPLKFIGKAISTLIHVIAVFTILSYIKPLKGLGTALLGATSVAAVIGGLAAQETFGNLIAGFFLALYQPFRLGDQITLTESNVTGTVTEINMRHTVITTFDGTRIIVPNSTMNTAIIEDKRLDEGWFNKRIVISVAYDTDIDFAKKLISDTISGLEGFADLRTEEEKRNGVPAVAVTVTEFLDSGIELTFRVKTKTSGEAYTFAGTVREALLKAFRENGISIPYPTNTVYLEK